MGLMDTRWTLWKESPWAEGVQVEEGLSGTNESRTDVYSTSPSDPEPKMKPMISVKTSTTWESTVTKVPSWPVEAQPLKQKDWLATLFLIGDLVLVMLPIYFILLAIAAALLNGKPTENNDFGQKVETAIELGPTIFPIVFAAISGRSMKMIARYLAERGAKLSTLELLMASQSVWGTIESQLLMRRLTLVGVNLLFLWSMSPIGGQASLRLLEKSSKSDHGWTKLRYLSTGPGAAGWAMSTTYVEDVAQMHALFTAALLAPNRHKTGPEDTWGNVKIPRLRNLDQSTQDSEGWIDVPHDGLDPEDYASLAGIPVVGLPPHGDASFSLESTHIDVECQDFVKRNVLETNLTELQDLVAISPQKNLTGWLDKSSFFMLPRPYLEHNSVRMDAFFGHEAHSKLNFARRTMLYTSQFAPLLTGDDLEDYRPVVAVNCSLGQIHTEADIQCKSGDCAARRLRKSRTDLRPQEVGPLDQPTIEEGVLVKLPQVFGRWRRGSSPTEQFLFNTTSYPFVLPTSEDNDERGWVDLSKLPPQLFSNRLELVLNTYYQITLAPNAYIESSVSTNFSLYGPDTLPISDTDGFLPGKKRLNTSSAEWWQEFTTNVYNAGIAFVGATTNATTTRTHKTYSCNFAWLAALMAASAIMFITGVSSLILKFRTLGPEMFGFVASMTYENPYVKIPKGGTMLDAMERARLLRDVEFQIGDVTRDGETGHIAFTAGVPLRKLDRGRTYH
ncbi:hypothetical protein M011DRAFT_477120 [Sporormia fimetaria CBS 119925]|uniref:Uncharacterized protein n=1 Tax=Sporormia fimetaria CBS 119925 TaxID=1340428 RepID=A0A6A6VC45_9PLEO|nr:hypothetical protein M011DRAFT_477120 [Sporormia fimetaria CBS 119925]